MANILSWAEFCEAASSSETFSEGIERAKCRGTGKGKGAVYSDWDDHSVQVANEFEVRVMRRGRLLQKPDLKFDSAKYTPKRLKLKSHIEVKSDSGFTAKGFLIAQPHS